MTLLDLLMRDDPSSPRSDSPPDSLITYIHQIRTHSLNRDLHPQKTAKLPRHVSVGMIPKKIHEVAHFSSYVSQLADSVSQTEIGEITHFVDFGSGHNYLGRALASPPFNKHVIAVESKGSNIAGAKNMDVLAGVAEREKVMRNKKVWRRKQDEGKRVEELDEKALRRAKREFVMKEGKDGKKGEVDLRPNRELETIYTPEQGRGFIQYVEHNVSDGDLSDVVLQIQNLNIHKSPNGSNPKGHPETDQPQDVKEKDINLMAISIHSCGNLTHHAIRSLLLNPAVKSIAIIGCCYNLLTSSLTLSPILEHPHLHQRPNLQPINSPSLASTPDPHGFPMSSLLTSHQMGLNITSKMMAVQAPYNWTALESQSFFTRHFYRALLQKLLLDFGVIGFIPSSSPFEHPPAIQSTEPIIIGSLRKPHYASFTSYVRGAISKLRSSPTPPDLSSLDALSDAQIAAYARDYEHRKKELSVTWSLMAFSASVVESLIVNRVVIHALECLLVFRDEGSP
ncbi:hypothetical protein B7494_g2651 [Chlorociboria aeruginascens]|nr:hypothetical protein B7494_g2651 [Chlorociboria aeruginascens]